MMKNVWYLSPSNKSLSLTDNKLKYAHTHTQTHLIKENEPNNLKLKEYEYEVEILTCYILIIFSRHFDSEKKDSRTQKEIGWCIV